MEKIRNDLDEHEQREFADLLDGVFERAARRAGDNSTEGRLDRCLLQYSGIGGVLFQAVKLIVSAHRLEAKDAVRNLLDAIGYAALACVELERVEGVKHYAKSMARSYEEELGDMLNPGRPNDIGA